MDQKIIDLYDEFTHGGTTRRELMQRLAMVVGGMPAAMANQLAVRSPHLAAAVAFYGRQAAVADVPKFKAALQLHYAGLDERINGGIPDYEAALMSAGVRYELHMYDGKNHAFHNDTSPNRFDTDAAALAWKRTTEFLERHLG